MMTEIIQKREKKLPQEVCVIDNKNNNNIIIIRKIDFPRSYSW